MSYIWCLTVEAWYSHVNISRIHFVLETLDVEVSCQWSALKLECMCQLQAPMPPCVELSNGFDLSAQRSEPTPTFTPPCSHPPTPAPPLPLSALAGLYFSPLMLPCHVHHLYWSPTSGEFTETSQMLLFLEQACTNVRPFSFSQSNNSNKSLCVMDAN